MALGKGLASLISNLYDEDEEEVIEEMEAVEEDQLQDLPSQKREERVQETHQEAEREAPAKKVQVTDELEGFEEYEQEETPEMPAKPLVTPLTIDPDGTVREAAPQAGEAVQPDTVRTEAPAEDGAEDTDHTTKVRVTETLEDNTELGDDDLLGVEDEEDDDQEATATQQPKSDDEDDTDDLLVDVDDEDFVEELPRPKKQKAQQEEPDPEPAPAQTPEPAPETPAPTTPEQEPVVVPTVPDPEPAPAPAPEPAPKESPATPVAQQKKKDAKVKTEAKAKEQERYEIGDGMVWDKHEEKMVHIAIGDIHINPLQPRQAFDEGEMIDLQESIEQHGILQPLVVSRLGKDKGYELVAGERRLRAAKELGWEKVPCVIRKGVRSDQSRLVLALIENIQRQNLNPVEEALAYQQLNEEYGLTHEEIGERVGRSRVGITNIVRILQLPAEIQRGLAEGKITGGHGRAILMIPDKDKQVRFYKHLLDEGLTVRKAEMRARRIQRTMDLKDPNRVRPRGDTMHIDKYAGILESRFGQDVRIRYIHDKHRYEVIFKAFNEPEIERLVKRLVGEETLVEPSLDDDVIDE